MSDRNPGVARWRTAAAGAFALVLSIACASGNRAAQPAVAPAAPATVAVAPTLPAPGGVLGELDQLFLDAYASRRAAWAAHGPVVYVLGSNLELHRAGQAPLRGLGIPAPYHALKSVAHLPFAVYLLLSPHANGAALPASVVRTMPTFRPRITAARTALDTWGFTPEQVRRQVTLLDRVDAFLAERIRTATVSGSELDAFAKELGPLAMLNAAEAGCKQVQTTHEQMLKWRAMMTPAEWSSLLVVNRGSHQARYRNAAIQYFAWLLNDPAPPWFYPGESLRVIYVESVRANERSVDIAATIDIDAEASAKFFGDKWRLSEDILSNGAASCVKGLQRP